MNNKKAPAPGRLHQGAGKYIEHNNCSTEFPICKLHHFALVDHIPSGCPFASADLQATFSEMQDRAWAHMDSEDPALSESRYLLSCYDTCWACFNENRTHPAVQRLRHSAQATAEPETVGTPDTCNGKHPKHPKHPARRPIYV